MWCVRALVLGTSGDVLYSQASKIGLIGLLFGGYVGYIHIVLEFVFGKSKRFQKKRLQQTAG